MERTDRRWLTWVAAAAWMALIFRLSALPGSDVPGKYGSLGHFVVYAVLAALYLLALDRSLSSVRLAVIAVALASLYGVTDELHQWFVPGRVTDPVDWLVDTLGAAVAALALLRFARWKRTQDTSNGRRR